MGGGTGWWPTEEEQAQIDKDAKLAGITLWVWPGVSLAVGAAVSGTYIWNAHDQRSETALAKTNSTAKETITHVPNTEVSAQAEKQQALVENIADIGAGILLGAAAAVGTAYAFTFVMDKVVENAYDAVSNLKSKITKKQTQKNRL